MNVGRERAGQPYRLLLGEFPADLDPVPISATGQAEFRSAGQVAIWVPASSANGS